MDLVTTEILLDCLNIGKVVFKKGLKGTIILGDHYQQVFTALPEHFTMTDYDIHIVSSTEVMEDLQIQIIIFTLRIQEVFIDYIIMMHYLLMTHHHIKVLEIIHGKLFKEVHLHHHLKIKDITLNGYYMQGSSEIKEVDKELLF